MKKYLLYLTGLFILLLALSFAGCKEDDPEPQYQDIEYGRLKGFNLLGKYDLVDGNLGYSEWNFQKINELGFNYVRLPVDYRTYTATGDWYSFNETALQEIDQAINWARKYKMHATLCLHRAPGYGVTRAILPANQQLDLWTDQEAQDAFLAQWAMFAERYKDIPVNALSFNLLNGPDEVSSSVYSALMTQAINEIRTHTPDRVIHVDGLNGARDPVTELIGMSDVVQSLHNYDPDLITRYYNSWYDTYSYLWPVPQWPLHNIKNTLYGNTNPEYKGPFIVEGDFSANSVVTINVYRVSVEADFYISLDDVVIFSNLFVPTDGEGDWIKVISTEEGYQNIYNKDYSVTLPADGEKLSFYLEDGDWLKFFKITIVDGTDTVELLPGITEEDLMPTPVKITSTGEIQLSDGTSAVMGSPLLDEWDSFSKTNNVPIIVSSFGVTNRTSHEVTLEYMEEMLGIMKDKDISWALWNFRGGMGIIDSDRRDVNYESFYGHLLDREMLNLLLEY